MKLFLASAFLAFIYMYVLMHTTDIVLQQTQQLSAQYSQAAQQADQISTEFDQ